MRKGVDVIVIIVHVDDLTIVTSSVDLMEHVKNELTKDPKISDMGKIHWILGFEVLRDKEKRTLSLSQEAYIRSILERFDFENITPRVPDLMLLSLKRRAKRLVL